MTFVAQFQFADSRDIVGPLPGDIMLIFARDKTLYTGGGPPYFYFEWYKSKINELVAENDVPAPLWAFIKCFGVRFRSVDYLNDKRALKRIEQVVLKEGLRLG